MKNIFSILMLAACIVLGVRCGLGLPGEGVDWLDDGPVGGGQAQPSLDDAGTDNVPPQPIEPEAGYKNNFRFNGGPEEPEPEPRFEVPNDFSTP
jgi:hypothetical protein